MKRLTQFIIFISLILFLSCEAEKKREEEPVILKKINIIESKNNTPKENDFQLNLELTGIVGEENLKQDIEYVWNVSEVILDIEKDSLNQKIISSSDKKKNELNDLKNNKIKIIKNYKSNDISSDILNDNSNDNHNYDEYIIDKNERKSYFLDVSNNSLNALLTVYKPAYYKITLTGTNLFEVKEISVIVKIENPELPDLYIKQNIPAKDDDLTDDYKGAIYLRYNDYENKSKNDKIYKIEAKNLKDEWINTGIKINPFYSFSIEAGTHVLDNETKTISNLGKNNILNEKNGLFYDFQNIKQKEITNSPVVLKSEIKNSILSIYRKGTLKWNQGDLFVTILSWAKSDDKKDSFSTFETILNEQNKTITTYLDNTYLTKIFIGSIGYKYNNYFVFYGPEGLESNDLDLKKTREYPALPYGYLLGKLGENGNVFPIGSNFSYIFSSDITILVKDKSGKYIEESNVRE